MVFKSRDYLIKENMDFIIHTTEQICKRKISMENDDELSISVIAFNKACDTYDVHKGDFKVYCRKVIKHALIDYFRKNSFNPSLYNDDDSFTMADYKMSMKEYEKQLEKRNNQEIILLFNEQLSRYNISLSDLLKASPKHSDTRNNLLSLCVQLRKNDHLMEYLFTRKCLNTNFICEKYDVKRKLLDKWRKYIIAILIVLSNPEFTYLKSYLNLEMAGDKID